MKAAIYSRYSSENQKESSIEDQQRNCKKRAEREGWKVSALYVDKAVSGSVTDRPEYQRMLADAKAKRFDILLVDDLSRLSRDTIETEQTRRRFVHWGIRLIGVSDGIDSSLKGNKMLAGVKGIMNDIFRDDLACKTRRGLEGQAGKGFHCGGRTYGYIHVAVKDPSSKDADEQATIIGKRREINPKQARWVKQIFEWYAAGRSPKWIAAELNRLNVPGPAAKWKRVNGAAVKGTWSAGAIVGDPKLGTGLLNNWLYAGVQYWNRREWRKDPDTGTISSRLRPDSEWIEAKLPELRIIPQDLWNKVRTRQLSRKQVQKTSGRKPKFLLSGLLKCGECGSNFIVQTYGRYACAGRINRGPSTCTNHLRVSQDLLEGKALAGLKTSLFSPEVFALIKKEVIRLSRERQRERRMQPNETPKLLAVVEKKIANILAAMEDGIRGPSTKATLERLEAERAQLQESVQPETVAEVGLLGLLPELEARYRRFVESLGKLPAERIDLARAQIQELVGQIKLIPTAEGYLVAEMTGSFTGLLKLTSNAKLHGNVVAGKGFEPLTFGL